MQVKRRVSSARTRQPNIRPSATRITAAAALFIVGLTLASPANATADDLPDPAAGWTVVREESGVKVWQHDTGTKFPTFHAVTTIDASLCEVLAVIRDVDRHTEWMKDCTEASWVEVKGADEADVYNRTRGRRWVGVQDRDVVLNVVVDYTAAPGEVRVRFQNTERPDQPPRPKVTRMPTLKGFYRLQATGTKGKTRVQYRVDADIGGQVPAMLVRRTVRAIPFDTLVRLREQAQREAIGELYAEEITACRTRTGNGATR
jgi:hypothetical protein